MHYKTIMLELLQESPALHHELTQSKQLLPALNRHASALKTRHAYWMSQLRQEQPQSAQEQIASAALEIAVQEMRDAFPNGLPQTLPLPEPFSLDAAMESLRPPTLPV
jgi:hypothetical protein